MNPKFYYEEKDGVRLLKCRPLAERGIPHAFATRVGGVSTGDFAGMNLGFTRGDDPACVRENYRRFAEAAGLSGMRFYMNHQVHGVRVRRIEADAPDECGTLPLEEADALVTDVPGAALCAFYADCVPILLADAEGKAVAAVHAGWRGTSDGVVKAAADALCRDFGCRPEQLIAAIGPSVSVENYEVGDEVFERFYESFGIAASVLTPLFGGKTHANLWAANREWLLRAGLLRENVHTAGICTVQNTELYFSHRVMGDRRGVLAAAIALPRRK